MKAQYSDKLRGLVKQHQIGRRCIDLKFDATAMEAWVNQLTTTDSKFEGVQEFGWNNTVTTQERRHQRLNKHNEQ